LKLSLIDALTAAPEKASNRLRSTLIKYGYYEQCARRRYGRRPRWIEFELPRFYLAASAMAKNTNLILSSARATRACCGLAPASQ